MTLKNLVYDYNQSKKIYDLIEEKSKENGTFIENTCFIWVKYQYRLKGDNPKSEPRTMTKCIMNGSNYKLKHKEVVEIIPAYTPNELYQHMPKVITIIRGNGLDEHREYYNLTTYHDITSIAYGDLDNDENILFLFMEKTIKRAIYKMVVALLEHGFKLSKSCDFEAQYKFTN